VRADVPDRIVTRLIEALLAFTAHLCHPDTFCRLPHTDVAISNAADSGGINDRQATGTDSQFNRLGAPV